MDRERIKSVLASKDYEINAITSTDGEKFNGQIATWVTQASMDPPYVAVCISPERFTYQLIKNSKVLAVNMLSKNQLDLVSHFGYSSGRNVDKFEKIAFKQGTTGSPIIDNVSAYLDCNVINEYDGGDHKILLCEVVDANIAKGGERISYQWLISQAQSA